MYATCKSWVLVALLLAARGAAAESFQGLGDLDGGTFDSAAYGLSADGGVVVGISQGASGLEAVRWRNGAMEPLGFLEGGSFSIAYAVSDDGEVVVGYASSPVSPGGEPFRFEGGEMLALGGVHPTMIRGVAFGVSGDGSTIVGRSFGGTVEMPVTFVPVYSYDLGELTQLPVTGGPGQAFATSRDGSVIAGFVGSPPGFLEFARWVDDGAGYELENLGNFTGSITEPRGMNPDGDVIVGWELLPLAGTQREALRWREASGFEHLGDLPGGERDSRALDVSADGATAVGWATADADKPFTDPANPGKEAMIWVEGVGIESLRDALIADFDLGEELDGWTLIEANAISDDALTIVGSGLDPEGFREGWIAFLPEPVGWSDPLAALSALAAIRQRGPRRRFDPRRSAPVSFA